MNETQELEGHLQKYFGYKTFRSQQREIITCALKGSDAVVLMPTGGGKSMCYQLPALLLDGITVVISPLIALMKDQVQALTANGVQAAYLNSSLKVDEERSILNLLDANKLKLLYISPERLMSGDFIGYLKTLNIKLFAIDEAHCVSSWGHHFRPEYRKLAAIKKEFPTIPVMALTATADKAVRSDIGQLLNLKNETRFVASFDRPNLSLAVLPGQKKTVQILKILKKYANQCGIIYCSSRTATEKLAEQLIKSGLNAKPYHAGLNAALRSDTQDGFINGGIKIIVATVAFGMGIDKPDVRFVIHYNMPGNLEGYYQEIGRAGRDGKPAEAVLFYSYRDVQTHLGFIDAIDDEMYKAIQTAKLERMKEYAEAQVCRRKILLTYFSEIPENDCRNCDVCENPPNYFDGTELAQMALSAVKRTNESVGISTLIEVLKGAYGQQVTEEKLDQIKTFGAGRNTTVFAWQLFIQQFIQHGMLEIDYRDHYHLKLTSLSHAILFEGKKVKLITPETIKERQKKHKESIGVADDPLEADLLLFEKLRSLRKTIASEIKKPAYVVFSDTTLRDMSAKMPLNKIDFMDVNGIGEHKAKLYAKRFIELIQEFKNNG